MIVNAPWTESSWTQLVERHPDASVFHTPGWLRALNLTYGYQPFVMTTQQGAMRNAMVLCGIGRWTRRRLVSLPFSDHCDVLLERDDELGDLLGQVTREALHGRWRSFEWRPKDTSVVEAVARENGLQAGSAFVLHRLDLTRPTAEIFSAFHQSSTQRAIRRAEREGLTCEVGTSERCLKEFYGLLRLTRRRHALPPQPFAWFRNLIACLGDGVAIYVARKDDRAVASVMTLRFKQTTVYKYGGSDAAYHRYGGMPFLLWQVVQDAKASGCRELDLGRSDLDQAGLIAFKDHLGAKATPLTYWGRPHTRSDQSRRGWVSQAARRVVPHLPDVALDFAGRVLYRHVG